MRVSVVVDHRGSGGSSDRPALNYRGTRGALWRFSDRLMNGMRRERAHAHDCECANTRGDAPWTHSVFHSQSPSRSSSEQASQAKQIQIPKPEPRILMRSSRLATSPLISTVLQETSTRGVQSFDCRFITAEPNGLAGPASLADLLDEELISSPLRFAMRQIVDDAYAKVGATAPIKHEMVIDAADRASLVRHGLGTTFMPASGTKKFPDLRTIPVKPQFERTIHLAWARGESLGPAAAKLAERLIAASPESSFSVPNACLPRP